MTNTVFDRARSFFHLFSVCLLVLFPSWSKAETGPTKTVEQIVQAIKTAGNPSGVVDFVNWESAFLQLPEQQKKDLGLDSANKMRDFYKEMLSSPSAVIRKQWETKLPTIPAEKQAAAKQSLEQMATVMQQKEKEMNERMAQTEYKVGEEKVTGNIATVKLTQVYKGESKTEDVKLEKVGDRWLLPSLMSMKTSGDKKPTTGGEAAAAPAATVAQDAVTETKKAVP